MRSGDRERDPGSASALALAVIAIAVVATVAVGRTGRVLIDRQRAQAAADAVALAAASSWGSSPAVPHEIASDNGAVLVSITDEGDTVVVTVRVGDVVATARAEHGSR